MTEESDDDIHLVQLAWELQQSSVNFTEDDLIDIDNDCPPRPPVTSGRPTWLSRSKRNVQRTRVSKLVCEKVNDDITPESDVNPECLSHTEIPVRE